MPHNSPTQAVAHIAHVDEAGAHRHFFRAEAVTVVARFYLLVLIQEGRPGFELRFDLNYWFLFLNRRELLYLFKGLFFP